MTFIIITGMSGAGKSNAIKCLEDLGFFCVDNLPVTLLPKFGELCLKLGGKMNRVAVVIDIREGRFLHQLTPVLAQIKSQGIDTKILFFDADNQTLMRRYSETRRKHPLGRRILEGITQERKLLHDIKAQADRICDTSNLTLHELRDLLILWVSAKEDNAMQLTLMSFGFKYGLPSDADMVMDVRFLPNPNYIRNLKNLTGKEIKVKNYVMKHAITKKFLSSFQSLLKIIIPRYVHEGKSYLTIAIGCTGGRHRSVVLAGKISNFLASQEYQARIIHRDIDR
ncbi:MAG: RNase adapter RapZ [bacterium]